MAIDYSRYYRAYAEMKELLNGDYAHEYLTAAMADGDAGGDELSGNAYNRVIDMDWVEMIEGKLSYIEKALDEQRKFIEEHKEVDRIDKVKQVGKDAVQHLTQHANLIMAIEPDGNVIPERLLNTHREDSFATYENRFLHTLIYRTIDFVEARFRALKDAPNDSAASIKMNREIMLNHQKFGFDINYFSESHDRGKVDKDEDISTLTDYERIERIRMRLDDFCGYDIMKALKGCIAVKSPINKTNCIKQDPAFKQCYDLWVFIEGYRKTGYVLEKNVFEGQMPEDVQRDMYDVMAYQHFVATINTNHALREKLHAEYLAENERRYKAANRPEEEIARYIEDKIDEVRREEAKIRLREVREREIVIAKLTAELEQAKEQIRARDLKIKELESTLNSLKKELEATREELRQAQVRIMDLEKEVEELKARVAALEARVAELEAQVAAQLARIASLERENAELREDVKRLESIIEQQRARIAELMQAVAERDEKIAAQAENIDALNGQVFALTNTVGSLTAENSTLRNTISDHERTIAAQADELEVKMATIESNNNAIAKLDGKLSKLRGEHEALTEKYANYQVELNELNRTIQEGNDENRELNHQIRVHLNTISAKDAIIATLREEKSELTGRIDGVAAIEAKAKAEVAEAREKVARTETECVGLNNTVAAYVASFAKRDAEIAELKDKVYAANVAKDAGMNALRDEYEAKLAEQRAMYEQKLDQLEAQMAASCTFTDEQKYTIRLNAEKKQIQKSYDEKLAAATKRAKKFVQKARVLVDDRPDVVLRLEGVEEYRK